MKISYFSGKLIAPILWTDDMGLSVARRITDYMYVNRYTIIKKGGVGNIVIDSLGNQYKIVDRIMLGFEWPKNTWDLIKSFKWDEFMFCYKNDIIVEPIEGKVNEQEIKNRIIDYVRKNKHMYDPTELSHKEILGELKENINLSLRDFMLLWYELENGPPVETGN